MKQSRFTGLLLCATLVFLLTSCGGSDSGEKANADSTVTSTDTATTAVIPDVVNTIVTSPQNMAIITHKVSNFSKWIIGYEEHDSARLANGLHNYVIGRGVQDSNMVLVALKADDVEKAKAFSKDAGLKKAMQKAGVAGAASISVLTATWQDTAVISSLVRSRVTLSVKDADAWLKSFQEGKQERLDNGIADRVVGHDVDDSKKISLVTAILDSAKANAYWKSDALKKRREAGGVIGEPARFVFRIVKRY